MKNHVFVIIPNWNGDDKLQESIDSVLAQSYNNLTLVIVDNASTDTSKEIITRSQAKDNRIRALYNDRNFGFTGGINPGFRLAIDEGAAYAAPFNNDAIADKHWLRELIAFMDTHKSYGIATCKMLHADGKTIDSTGDMYSIWGLPYPRGRDEATGTQYDHATTIFGASGGASIFRVSMLAKIGLFDQDFFAYYEDIDLSFRAQLAGYKVGYAPTSIVYHEQGGTSSKISGFTTYQYMKNIPWVLYKDVPGRLFWQVWPRLTLCYSIFYLNAVFKHKTGVPATKGAVQSLLRLPKKLVERRRIQKKRTVSIDYISSTLLHDLPPNARKLKTLRARWWRLIGKKSTDEPAS